MRTKIKVKAVPVKPVLDTVESKTVKMLMDSTMPRKLADTLEAWKVCGNKWSTCLETELELFARNMELDGGKVDINAVRTLVFLGYMVDQRNPHEDFGVVRYRLTKEGQKIIGLDSTGTEPVTKKVKVSLPEKTATVRSECSRCEGIGVDSKGSICKTCNGYGSLSVGVTNAKASVRVSKAVVRRKSV